MENKFAKKISLTIPESVSKHVPNVSIPEFTLPEIPKVTIPEEARRPIYATVGAAEVAVERVRGAVATMQVRAVDTQKNLSEKATEKLNDSAASASKAASTAYAEFTRRGEETLGRIWPEAMKTEAPAKATSAKAATPKAATKTAPKKRTAPKAAPKTATAKATAPEAATVKATAPKAAAPKAATPKAAAPKAAPKQVEVETADQPASE